MNIVESPDRELAILENIYHSSRQASSPIKQRDLARIVGISLGMTNAVLKRLVQKGWITIRKINSRNIQYAISVAGIEEITRRSYRFLKRTIKNIVMYRKSLESFCRDVQKKGFHEIVLVGQSDLDFLIEDICGKIQLGFIRSDTFRKQGGYFNLLSEEYTRLGDAGSTLREDAAALLHDILMGL
jgi:DNA-binding MarR family transcriptional regulator